MNPMFGGRYRIISELGQGGMGVTYRAWDSDRDVPVVIKQPRKECRDADSLRRFAREIEAMVTIQHDHIVPVMDHGMDDGVPFIVMRYLPGGSLADQRRLHANGSVMPTPPGLLRFWLPSIADAVDFVHRHGVVHRDVKPRNIFFDGFWNAFLGDFGIAKVLDESGGLLRDRALTATTFAMGTQEYMAPELFLKTDGVQETGKVDQYALAVTVYEMLSGVRPFTGAKAHIAVEHLQMQPPSLRKSGLGLPASLCAAIERALEKRPENRFPTCAAFAAAAIAEVPALEQDPGVARLLCPKCGMVLRIPVTSGGRSGACPTCRSVMRIAPDLGALWLSSEDAKDGGTAAPETGGMFAPDKDLTAEDLTAADSSAAPPPDRGPRHAERKADDHPMPDWLRQLVLILPVITAVVTLVITHEVLSFYHEDRVDEIIQKYDKRVDDMNEDVSDKVAKIDRLSAENNSLSEDVVELRQFIRSSSFVQDVTTLSPEKARVLVQVYPDNLQLDGLESLLPETAAELAKHAGDLSLNGVIEISDEAARNLAKHRGRVRLHGLRRASANAVIDLRNNPGIELPEKFR